MLRTSTCFCLALISLPCADAKIGVEKVAEKFDRPVWVGQPVGISAQLWVVEQEGKIWVIDAKTGSRGEKPFLDITAEVTRKNNEQGLLGLAFAPDFKTSGRFYVNYTDKSSPTRTHIARFTGTKGQPLATVDPGSEETLFTYDQPFGNHNGGWLDFGPDGMLYVSAGDGGAGDDPHGNGQSLNTHLAKMLRIDVSGEKGYRVPKDNPFVGKPNAKPEIWCYGLRNPWRCSFDRKIGDLWIGDVGQNQWEEIDHVTRAQSKGANFGWRLREGDVPNPKKDIAGDTPAGAIDPVYVYKHGSGKLEGMSVTGGYVSRGPIKELEGRYLFADYQSARIWSMNSTGKKATGFKDLTDELQPDAGRISQISSFGEDNSGAIYIVDLTGSIYRIIEK